ncbi:hypothetical protein OG21DRAFT_1489775 [Imleria badia]|nr:hypothetical protein OG21DRAFT_1489775 [Imleria badia]
MDDNDNSQVLSIGDNTSQDQSQGIAEGDCIRSPSVVEIENPESETVEDKLKHLQKDWTSPVYAFFDLEPAHEFKCSAQGCKVKIQQYLDTKDARSTGNMRKHVKACWGSEALNAADDAKDASDMWHKIVYVRTCQQIAKMLKGYDGKLSFTTDTWMSPNHQAFVTFVVHLEKGSIPLTFPLDIVKVAKSHTGMELAKAFAQVLQEFELSEKLSSGQSWPDIPEF